MNPYFSNVLFCIAQKKLSRSWGRPWWSSSLERYATASKVRGSNLGAAKNFRGKSLALSQNGWIDARACAADRRDQLRRSDRGIRTNDWRFFHHDSYEKKLCGPVRGSFEIVEALVLWKLCGSPPCSKDCRARTRLTSKNKIAQQTEKAKLPSSKRKGWRILSIKADLKWERGKRMVAYSEKLINMVL